MIENNYFMESIPSGISDAINEYDEDIDCCNQDSYEILIETFGDSVNPDALKCVNDVDLLKFSNNVKNYFELSVAPSVTDSSEIIKAALIQWGG